jgi:serine/threonine protein kinase
LIFKLAASVLLFGVDEAGLAMEAFVTLELVGQGSFGKVYKGRRRGTAEIVALKFIPKRSRTTKELQVSEASAVGCM